MTSNLRCAIQQPMNYVMRLKAGGTLGRGMQCIAFPKVQCKLIREYTWGSSLKLKAKSEWRGGEQKKLEKLEFDMPSISIRILERNHNYSELVHNPKLAK